MTATITITGKSKENLAYQAKIIAEQLSKGVKKQATKHSDIYDFSFKVK